MAFDCFIKIDGMEGESTDYNHQGWIEVIRKRQFNPIFTSDLGYGMVHPKCHKEVAHVTERYPGRTCPC